MGEQVEVEQAEVEQAVQRLLTAAPTMFLSTAGDEPWVAGTFFAQRGLFELGIVLEQQGRTLRNIRQNPRVAMVVSSGNPFEPFLQGAADAEVLEDEEGTAAVIADLRAKAPQIEPLLGAPLFALRLHVRGWRATDVVRGWLPGKELPAPRTVSTG